MKKKTTATGQQKNLIWAFCLSLLFALAIQQAPLFSSNQNTYLLKGIADAIGNPLATDWLANQTDHIVLFSLLTTVSFKISPFLFYVYHAFLATIFVFSLYLISARFQTKPASIQSTATFFFLLFLAAKTLSIFKGLAGQYILGSIFQPSVFGVFLLVSIAFFCFEGYLAAILCILLSAYFHPTYILHAGFLTFTYQVILVSEKKFRYAIFFGLFALIAILPLLYSLYDTFGNLPSTVIRRSQEILVYERIPHHALTNSWLLSKKTILGFGLLGAAIFVYRKNQMVLLILAIPLVLSIAFVAIADISNNLSMLLMFGQRSSVWLIPLAASLLIARFTTDIDLCHLLNISKERLLIISILFMITASTLGVVKTTIGHFKVNDNKIYSALASLNYSDGALLIPPSRHDIRLNARVPIFVDWKSHPYKGDEVIEWYARVLLARQFYDASTIEEKRLAIYKIRDKQKLNFILTGLDQPLVSCSPIYEDNEFFIYDARKCFAE